MVPFLRGMPVSRGSPALQSRSRMGLQKRTVAAAFLSAVGLAVTTSIRGFCGQPPPATHRFSGCSRTALRAKVLGGGLRWEAKVPAGQDPLFVYKTEDRPDAPLPWRREQCEVMVDAMSVIQWYWEKIRQDHEDLVVENDMHVGWPQRVFQAAHVLAGHYGRDRPPSPWCPVMVVYDSPDLTNSFSGLKAKTWKNLKRQGPRNYGLKPFDPVKVTMTWSESYVDQSASGFTRCDREILYMLEVLTRDFPRRQVLVTEDPALAEDATRYCTVRGVKWFEKEILNLGGERGPHIIEALMGGSYGIEEVTENLPKCVAKAFTAQ